MVQFIEKVHALFGANIRIPVGKEKRETLLEEIRKRKIIGTKTKLPSFLRQLNHYGFQRNPCTNEYVHRLYPEKREHIIRWNSPSSTQKTKKRSLDDLQVQKTKKQRLDRQKQKEINSFKFHVPKSLPEFTSEAFALDPLCYEKAFRFYKKNMHAYNPQSRILFI